MVSQSLIVQVVLVLATFGIYWLSFQLLLASRGMKLAGALGLWFFLTAVIGGFGAVVAKVTRGQYSQATVCLCLLAALSAFVVHFWVGWGRSRKPKKI